MNKPFSRFKQGLEASNAEPIQTELMALEARIMFDGAAAVEAADVAMDAIASTDAPDAPDQQETSDALVTAIGEMPQSARNEIYFVDAAVQDPAALFAAIPVGAEIVLLDASQDGVEQIASVLDGRNDVDAIHILAHGEEGRLVLGDTVLNAESILGEHSDDLASIGQALSSTGDILIYGCDFGQDQTALVALADATGADVAASDDASGAAILGGNWSLEVTSGLINTTALSAVGFEGLLAVPEVTIPDAALGASEDTDLAISGVSVADEDGDDLDVSLDLNNGTITLSQTTNLTVSGDGTGSVSLSGSAADINNALSGMIYRADSNFNGTDTLTIEADDGSTVTSESASIQVASVNDNPSLSPTNPSVPEGGVVTLTEAHFGLDDPDLDIALNTNLSWPSRLFSSLTPAT